MLAQLLLAALLWSPAECVVTVYNVPFGNSSATASALGSAYTGLPAFNTTTLQPPPPPQVVLPATALPPGAPPGPPPAQPGPSSFPIQLYLGGMSNLSIPQKGNFLGFSVELSVADHIRESRFTWPGWHDVNDILTHVFNSSREGLGTYVFVSACSVYMLGLTLGSYTDLQVPFLNHLVRHGLYLIPLTCHKLIEFYFFRQMFAHAEAALWYV